MLETIVLAGALFVCLGDVYSDTPEPVVIRFRIPARKASARLRKRRNSTQNCRCPQRAMPERHRRTPNPIFRRRQSRNVRCTRNGSSCPPSRAGSEPATSRQESLNGGRTSSRSSGTIRPPTVGNHPRSSPRWLAHFWPHLTSPSSFGSLARVYPRDFRSTPDTGLGELPDNLTVALPDVSLPE